jgi:SAM-dependent methyltransferase
MADQSIGSGREWVRESAFGVWFLNSWMWIEHVLNFSLDGLEKLMDPKLDRYPAILDVGCGHGNSLVELDRRFHPDRIIALDVDPEIRQRAAPNAARCRGKVEFVINDAASMSVPDASVDMVFCHQTFHHLIDQEAAAREFYRVLKPGGVLLFAESCRRYIHSWLIRFLFRHPMDVQKTDQEYLTLLKATGFEFRSRTVSKPFLWWSRPDLGLLEILGRKPPQDREETLLYLAAYRPSLDQ